MNAESWTKSEVQALTCCVFPGSGHSQILLSTLPVFTDSIQPDQLAGLKKFSATWLATLLPIFSPSTVEVLKCMPP
jgi:hypothetical protein